LSVAAAQVKVAEVEVSFDPSRLAGTLGEVQSPVHAAFVVAVAELDWLEVFPAAS
jgi:hypothetical protein